jgi:hypothetical protein
MAKPRIIINPEKTTRFLEKLKALRSTDPAKLIPAILGSGVENMPGSVEFNIARMMGTSVNQVRAWCAQSSDFREAVNILSTHRTAELLAKLEEGELGVPSVDRLVYANLRESFEPPKVQKSIGGEVSLAMINLENVNGLIGVSDGPESRKK